MENERFRITGDTPLSELRHNMNLDCLELDYVDLDEGELAHFKYIKREKQPNGKWRYYYDVDELKSDAKKASDAVTKKTNDVINNIKETLANLNKSANAKKTEIKNDVKKTVENIDKSIDAKKAEIKKTVENVNEKIDAKKTEIKNDIKKTVENIDKGIDAKKTEIKNDVKKKANDVADYTLKKTNETFEKADTLVTKVKKSH